MGITSLFHTNCWFSGRIATKNRSFCSPLTLATSFSSPGRSVPDSTGITPPSRFRIRNSTSMGSRFFSSSIGEHSTSNTLR